MTVKSEPQSQANELLWRDKPGYEQARRRMWNACVPLRFPAAIVQPRDEQEVIRAVRLLQGCEDLLYPRQKRYAADNMWTRAGADDLIPGMRKIASTLPEAPSHMMWMLWGPIQNRPDMAFSQQDELYIALYAIWDKEADDERHQNWATDQMRGLETLASGIQLAGENLGRRPFRFMAEANLARLEALRPRCDPEGMFHSYMGVPHRRESPRSLA